MPQDGSSPLERMNNLQTNRLSKVLFQIKDSAIFLGCLYFVVFIILLPEFIARQNIINGLQLVFLGALSVLIVHLFINWLYVAVTLVPLIMSAIFFAAGLVIWLFAPLSMFPIQNILQVFAIFGVSFDLSLLNEFVTRVGQFLMIIGGGLWWVVNKTKDLNYKALIAYITTIILFGVLLGVTSFTRLAGFLFIWLVVYSKVNGQENIPDLLVLFKVVATAAVVFGVFSVEIVNLGKLYFATPTATGLRAFISLYKTVIGILIITGVWKPNLILVRLPYRAKIQAMFARVMQSSFLRI